MSLIFQYANTVDIIIFGSLKFLVTHRSCQKKDNGVTKAAATTK